MKVERWKQVRSTFEDLLEIPSAEREEWLDAKCAGDPELKTDVCRLLDSHGELTGFLSMPDSLSGEPEAGPPARIGDFEIRREIASGGMGTVYEAVQHHPHRTVALKMMRGLIVDESAHRRFQYESEILARLRHPGIAQVFASGTHDAQGAASRPYIVLEYVPSALDLITYCNQVGLDVKARLALFVQICEAVHYAHQKGIIHRDLKPSNIIVDSSGVPKLIDFGVARTVVQDEELSFRMTQTGEIVGTLYYMSPEQIEGAAGDIDTRTDVYSLGVVLFELLTGRLPFDFSDANLTQSMRIITDSKPTPPRAVISSLSSDLDWVVLRALTRDRNERYGSASDLAADLRRHLSDQPVLAGPPSSWYLLQKLVRRNPVPAVLVALLLLSLVGFGLLMAVQKARIAKERDRANQEALASTQVANFLSGLFQGADPWQSGGRSMTLRDLVDRGAADVNEQLRDSGLVRARLLSVLGQVYASLAEHGKAGLFLQEAAEIARRFPDEGSELLPAVLRSLAWHYKSTGHPEAAIPVCREALELDERTHGSEHVLVATSLNHLATMQRDVGQLAEARGNFERALAMRERLLGPDHLDVAFTLYHYGSLLRRVGEQQQARAVYERATTLFESALGPTHPALAWCVSDLSKVLSSLGELEPATRAAARALEIREQGLPEGHPDFADAYSNLAYLRWKSRDYDQALEEYERALAIQIESLGRAHPRTIATLSNLAIVFENMGRPEEAEVILQRAADAVREAGAGREPRIVTSLQRLANLQVRRNQPVRAEENLRGALEVVESLRSGSQSQATSIRFSLASLLTDELDWLEASDLYAQVLEDRVAHPEWNYPDLNRVRFRSAAVLLRLDLPEAAERILLEALLELDVVERETDPLVGDTIWLLGQSNIMRGRVDQAAQHFDRSLDLSRERRGAKGPGHLFLASRRAAVFGREAEAIDWLERALEAGLDAQQALDSLRLDALREWPAMRALRDRLRLRSVGFRALFDGRSLDGWWGAGTEDSRVWMALDPADLEQKRQASLADIHEHWSAQAGELVNDGQGLYLTTEELFGDFELRLEYRTVALADSGIYLRGIPQVQIWDTTESGGKWKIGADKGSGGLWNNDAGSPGKDPLQLADRPFGEWNQVRLVMVGERVSVWLNEKSVVDQARLQNYFDRSTPPELRRPIPKVGPIQLQTHGGEIRWRRLFIREIETQEANRLLRGEHEGFEPIFNGRDLSGWRGPTEDYEVKDGAIVCREGRGGTIYHQQELSDFELELEIQLPSGGNNGLAIHYPGEEAGEGQGVAAYAGLCELQVLDDTHQKYKDLDPRQFHGSAYGQVAAERGYLRNTGEWNFQRVRVQGSHITVELNGIVILDRDLATVSEHMYPPEKFSGRSRTSGYFGLAGHSDPVRFRNLRIRRL